MEPTEREKALVEKMRQWLKDSPATAQPMPPDKMADPLPVIEPAET